MTEQQGSDKHIKCSSCKCKYINDDEHIKNDFGYSRLKERFKTRVKCRERGREQNKMYREAHKEEIAEYKRGWIKQHYQDNKEYHQAKQT